jgi:hypothetical protein
MKPSTFIYLLCFFVISSLASAQFLPANKTQAKPLTQEVLSRWIETNQQIRNYQSLIEQMLPTDAEAKAFEQLSYPEQDAIVNKYLQRKGMFEPLNTNMKNLGWTGVADYMRTSTQIGNAIAADLQSEMVAKLTPEQAKAVMDQVDSAVKAVPKADLDFIRANKNRLQKHIQGYSKTNN